MIRVRAAACLALIVGVGVLALWLVARKASRDAHTPPAWLDPGQPAETVAAPPATLAALGRTYPPTRLDVPWAACCWGGEDHV